MVRSVSACVAGAMGHGDPQVDALPEVRDVEDVLTCHSLPAVQGVPMLSHGQKIPVSQDVQSFSWLAYVQNIWATQEEEKTRALPDVRNTALLPDVRNTLLLPDARSSLPPHGITPCSRGLQPPSFRCRRWLCLHGFLPKMLVLLGILLIVCPALGLKCRSYETISMGEIVPRLDMEVEVGQELEVYCNFNSSELANANVSFRTLSRQAGYETLDVERVNASTIKTTLSRSAPDEFKLSCSYREDGSNKWTTACLKNVDFGYAPLPLEDFGCVSPNWSYLNCSWRRPLNPINTNYTFYFFVRNLVQLSPIEGVSQRQNWFKLESDRNYGTRANVTILITASNSLGVRNFTHDVDVYSVVVPSPPPWVNATEVGVAGASLTWQLDHRMDAFPAPLLQELAWRVLPSFSWTKTVSPATYVEVTTPAGAVEKHVYHAHVPLPYKHVPYELRVRLHTGQGPVRDDFWSQPAFVRVTTLSARPELNVSVDPSSYETHDYIESRDVFVYWRQLDPLHENGPDFHYRVLATADPPAASPSPSPVIAYRTYAKFPQMAKNVSYSFEITAVNDVGAAPAHSVVVVPPTSLTPDVPEVFTVIKYKTEQDRLLYRLMWKPPLHLGTDGSPVVSYTFFWCPKPTFDLRCEEDLQWETTGQNLESYRVRDQNLHHSLGAGALGLLYERNMTDLPQNRQFGIAAIAASGMSSGIKWATCSVPYDDSPPAPRAPSADCLSSRSVKLSWNFECPDKSAVPLYVRISFCETGPAASPDAARCDTNVTVEERPLTGPAVIDGLRPSSTVIFFLSVVSVVGTSRDSVPVRLTLPEDVPEGPPQSLVVTSRTNTSLTLQWTSPLDVTTNGQLVAYQVTTSPPSGVVRVAGRDTQVVLRDLRPYQSYQVLVVACTRAGCAVNHSAVAGATTRPGLPEKVEQLSVSRRDGRMSWAYTPDLCHSASCSFDVIVVNNDTVHSYTGIREHALSLRGLNLTCVSGQPLNVSVRATGVDDLGAPLHGPWHVKEEPCVVSVVTSLEWWIVAIVVAVGILITVAIFVVTKCGLSAIREIMTAPNLPDFKSGDLKSIGEKKVKPDLPPTGPASSQALFNPAYTSLHLPSPVTRCPPQQDLFDEGKRMPLLSQSSVNSETEGPEEASERHERNPSGDSSRGGSSEADSALASTAEAQDSASQQDSASASSQDSAHSSLRQGRDLWPPVGTVRQRSPGPYVLHGERFPHNISEGYVAIRSDPNLPIKDPMQSSTPNLSAPGSGIPMHLITKTSLGGEASAAISRRSSTCLLPSNKNSNFSSPPYSNASSPLPAYSRHSFSPPGFIKGPSVDNSSVDFDEPRYVAIAHSNDVSRLNTPESLCDQPHGKRRPTSIPSLLNIGKSEEKHELPGFFSNAAGAYSVVGKRKNAIQPLSSSQGYVTLSNQPPRSKAAAFTSNNLASGSSVGKDIPDTAVRDGGPIRLASELPSESPAPNYCTLEDLESLPRSASGQRSNAAGYVTAFSDEGFPRKSSKMLDSGQSSMTPSSNDHYVTAAPDCWAFTNPRPRQLDFSDEVRFVASAPIENQRGRKCSQIDHDDLKCSNERPNTCDGVNYRNRYPSNSPPSMWITGAPSLSKQSSGYVSQEALSSEPLVISPKRLFAHSNEAKASKSIPTEVSFV